MRNGIDRVIPILIVVLLMISPLLIFSTEPVEAEHVGSLIQINYDEADQRNPDIHGNFIVWEDHRNGNADIYLLDLSTGMEHQITADIADQVNPMVHGNIIVWEDYRNGNADIYIFDIGTSTEYRITNDGQRHINPDIDYGMLVWRGHKDGNSGVIYHDLATGYEIMVSRNIEYNAYPRIHDMKIVWHNTFPLDIIVYNLTTSTEKSLTDWGGGTYPAVYGDRIVFEDTFFQGTPNILFVNDTRISYVQVTTILQGSQKGPEIYGDRIVYSGNRGESYDIYLYDLITNLETQITTNVDMQMDPAIFGDIIVWEDQRNGNWDIYMMVLDKDNDGVSDDMDAFPENPSEHMDSDQDWIGDNADPDDDNDGVVDSIDDFPYDPFEWNDFDGDGWGDNFDTDDDNDGVIDSEDPDPLNQIDVVYFKLDEIILRIINLHTDLAFKLDVLQHNILTKLRDVNDTVQGELTESIGDILEKLLAMETSILNIGDDLNDEESFIIQKITEYNEGLSNDILDVEELIDLSFSLLNAYIELINGSIDQNIGAIGSDMGTVLGNLSDIQDLLLELSKVNEIVDGIEKIDHSLEVQQESIDDSGSSNNTFFIVLIILLTVYSAILLVAIFKEKVFAGFGTKDKEVERW